MLIETSFADNDYVIFIQIPGLFKCKGMKNVFLTLHPTGKHLQLSTGNKKQFIVTERFHLLTARLSKDQRNQVIGVLKMGSTVNDIAHQFGCSRQTIHYLMNRYNKTGYVRVHARPGCACVTTLRHYRVNTLTHGNHYCSSLRGSCTKDN